MQILVKSSGPFVGVLRDKGFRATYGRVALLEALAKSSKPISVEAATKAVRGKLDLVNTHRALEAFTRAGLVRRVDVGHRHIHYGLASSRRHKHEIVCVCGLSKTL